MNSDRSLQTLAEFLPHATRPLCHWMTSSKSSHGRTQSQASCMFDSKTLCCSSKVVLCFQSLLRVHLFSIQYPTPCTHKYPVRCHLSRTYRTISTRGAWVCSAFFAERESPMKVQDASAPQPFPVKLTRVMCTHEQAAFARTRFCLGFLLVL